MLCGGRCFSAALAFFYMALLCVVHIVRLSHANAILVLARHSPFSIFSRVCLRV